MDRNLTCGNRYVAYFDILGFKNMLINFKEQHGDHIDVFVSVYYSEIVKAISEIENYNPDDVNITWFSDSFLLYSHDDTLRSFNAIEMGARHFFWKIVCKGMPLQGALGFGEFYGDRNLSIYLGQALIDAYQYAENQDWIGYIIIPSVLDQLAKSEVSLLIRGYQEHNVAFKQNCKKRLYAYKPRNSMLEPMKRKIIEMQSQARQKYPKKYNEMYQEKYERTIAFLNLDS